jgi:UDP-N-acetylglucosamine transferase subunit ALG13
VIFLTVGNWQNGFDRLVEAFDRLKAEGVVSDSVVAQIGDGSFKPRNFEAMDYCTLSQFTNYMNQAQIIVSHAGIGTIFQAIEIGKPLIAVPRKAHLGECNDDHQLTTARQLEQEGKILVAYEISQLKCKLDEALHFLPAKNNCSSEIKSVVSSFLEELSIKKYGTNF